VLYFSDWMILVMPNLVERVAVINFNEHFASGRKLS
jgi:hypothetical protein